MNKYYLTTAIPYVNAAPHIGHVLEYAQSDTVRRYYTLRGYETLLLSGADENALKNVQAAEKAGEDTQQFVDKNALLFKELLKKLGVEVGVFQKGSDKGHHFPSSQKLWELCDKSGDIYKQNYKGLYCVGCEAFYSREELDESGECPEHPGKKLEEIEEANYFFRLSKYQNKLIELIESNTYKITPESRKNEVLSLLRQPLHDISISRSNERAKNWGVPVPEDPTQKIYVWFDALNIYQSGIGFGWDEEKWKKWWPADLHVIGKGIIRFHAIYWPAFLLSANLPLPKQLLVHGYLTINGQKISKSLGNVIDPVPLIDKYGADAIRYYCLAKISPFADGDFTLEKFIEVYNADLANGLGNLVARVAKLCENNGVKATPGSAVFCADLIKALEEYKFNEALAVVWELIAELDKKINIDKPWGLSKDKAEPILKDYVKRIQAVAFNLQPFLPQTSEKILKQFSGEVKSSTPLFPRI